MSNQKTKTRFSRRELLPGFLASAVFPAALFAYFCARNVREIQLLRFAFACIVILFLYGAASFAAGLLVFRSPFPALVFSAVFWAGSYLEPVLNRTILKPLPYPFPVFTVLLLAAAVLTALFSRRAKNPEVKTALFLAVAALLAAFNVCSLGWTGIRKIWGINPSVNLYRTSFTIASDAESPNIFWIHPDGMLGVNAMEKYFHDPQEEFLSALAERGFEVSPGAAFEAAHRTKAAIAMLFSPDAYDDWLADCASTYEAAMQSFESNDPVIEDRLFQVRENTELQNAFFQKGYYDSLIGCQTYFYPYGENAALYDIEEYTENPVVQRYQMGNIRTQRRIQTVHFLYRSSVTLSSYLHMAFWPFYKVESTLEARSMDSTILVEPYLTSLTDAQREELLATRDLPALALYSYMKPNLADALYELLQARFDRPQFTILHDLSPHYPFLFDADGALLENWEEDDMNPLNYHGQHVWSGKILVNLIDQILEADPDAVIVIQSDHGLHGNSEEQFRTAFGEDVEPLELWNNTMSAIRVPERYRNGEEHYAVENPLNIARYLVNRFVGQNYAYLDNP